MTTTAVTAINSKKCKSRLKKFLLKWGCQVIVRIDRLFIVKPWGEHVVRRWGRWAVVESDHPDVKELALEHSNRSPEEVMQALQV